MSSIAMEEMLGFDQGARLWIDIEAHLTPARVRAAEVLPSPELQFPWEDWKGFARVCEERLPTLMLDLQWRDHTIMTILALARAHEAAIARWASTFGVLGDSAGFRRVAHGVAIIDHGDAVIENFIVVQDAPRGVEPYDKSDVERSIRVALEHWGTLYKAFVREALFWHMRQGAGSPVAPEERPVSSQFTSIDPFE